MTGADLLEQIPIFPLQTVLFPDGRLSLRIFEPRYVDLVRDCLRGDTGFGVVAIKDGREVGTAAVPFPIGTFARIIDWSQGSDGLLNITLKGTSRFRIHSFDIRPNQLTVAQVSWLEVVEGTATPEQYVQLNHLLESLLENNPAIGEPTTVGLRTACQVTYRLAEMLPISIANRVELLALDEELAQIALIDREIKRLINANN